MFFINWLKQFGIKQLIREMDQLEPYFAAKIREAQKGLNTISPDEFSKVLVDDVQLKLCRKFDINPEDIGLKP